MRMVERSVPVRLPFYEDGGVLYAGQTTIL